MTYLIREQAINVAGEELVKAAEDAKQEYAWHDELIDTVMLSSFFAEKHRIVLVYYEATCSIYKDVKQDLLEKIKLEPAWYQVE